MKKMARGVRGRRRSATPRADRWTRCQPNIGTQYCGGGADARQADRPIQTLKLSEIGRHVRRVSWSRCGRIVEIYKADAVRLYGPEFGVEERLGQRLLDDTCTARTGRLEEDGCWPSYDVA